MKNPKDYLGQLLAVEPPETRRAVSLWLTQSIYERFRMFCVGELRASTSKVIDALIEAIVAEANAAAEQNPPPNLPPRPLPPVNDIPMSTPPSSSRRGMVFIK